MAEKGIGRLCCIGRCHERDVHVTFLFEDLKIEESTASLLGTNEIADFVDGVSFVDQMQG
jgi:hypothetical protein